MVVADAVRFLSLSVLTEMAPRKLAKLLDHGFYKTEDLRRHLCKEKRPTKSQEMDHILELQIVKRGLNSDEFQYNEERLKKLINFFNECPNIQVLSKTKNQKKKTAAGLFLKGKDLSKVQIRIIRNIREKWVKELRGLLKKCGDYADFIRKMNMIMGCISEYD